MKLLGLITVGLALAGGSTRTHAQPEEIRIRGLSVPRDGVTVEPVDLLGEGGIVIRDELPGQFWAHLPSPVGDVNGDGFSDLGIFWGAIGKVQFEVLYVVYGRPDLPKRLHAGNIGDFSTRYRRAHPDSEHMGSLPRVNPAGDIDGDGFDDFFIGIRSFTPVEYSEVQKLAGFVTLIYGTGDVPSEVDLAASSEAVRTARFSSRLPEGAQVGEDTEWGGDVNGDGIADFVFGGVGAGLAYVLSGRAEPYEGLIDLEEIGSSLGGTVIADDGPGDGFGDEVAFAGDVNGDGFDDVLIGATEGNFALLVFGGDDLPTRLGSDAAVGGGRAVRFLRRTLPSDERQSLASLGDLDGDGLGEFVIGSGGEGVGLGAAYIIRGQREFGPEVSLQALVPPGTRFIGGAGEGPDLGVITGNGVGRSLTPIDYDSDGVQDLLIGNARTAAGGVEDSGSAYVLEGPFPPGSFHVDRALRTGELEGVLLTTEIPEWMGLAVHDLGDMNGDGARDILVTAPYVRDGANHLEPGLSPDPSVYVVFGTGEEPRALKIDEVDPRIAPLEGGVEVTLLGAGFTSETDVHIGGRRAQVVRVVTSARLVVEVPAGERPGAVEVLVERGAESARARDLLRYVEPYYPDIDVHDLTPEQGFAIDAAIPLGFAYETIAAVLDHDGDGFADLVTDTADGLVIVYGRGGPPAGPVRIAPGGEPPDGAARLRLSDREGHTPYAVGDVNLDGIEDLAVLSEGVITLVFGGERLVGTLEVSSFFETGEATLVSVSSSSDRQGVAGRGDFDGDGIGDLVFHRRGVVYVVRGRAEWPPLRGLAGEPELRFEEKLSQFGTPARLIGDLDGDGASELLIGVPGLHWSERGNGFLVFGGPGVAQPRMDLEALVESGGAFRLDSVKEKDSLGFRVAAVGDFSGDGVPDLALSAQAGSLEFSGESYVVFGGADLRGAAPLGLAELGSRGVRIRGEFGYDEAVDIAPAGDFNGDGRKDLLVSGGILPGFPGSNPWAGRSYVVFGGARGLLDLGELGEHGFRIEAGAERAESLGAGDFNGDGFDDVVVRHDTLLHVIFGHGPGALFIRGDANRDGGLDLSDAVATLGHLFVGTVDLRCEDAADADDNGRLELTDAVYLLGHLFLGNASPPAPFPEAGVDPTEDGLPRCSAGG